MKIALDLWITVEIALYKNFQALNLNISWYGIPFSMEKTSAIRISTEKEIVWTGTDHLLSVSSSCTHSSGNQSTGRWRKGQQSSSKWSGGFSLGHWMSLVLCHVGIFHGCTLQNRTAEKCTDIPNWLIQIVPDFKILRDNKPLATHREHYVHYSWPHSPALIRRSIPWN